MAAEYCPQCGLKIRGAAACPRCGHVSVPPPGASATTQAAAVRLLWGFEWRTRAEVMGWPLIHIAIGRNKQTGRLLVAKGIIAIGQFAIGVITIAQFGIGAVFAFGQFTAGIISIGQVAVGGYFGLGQFATGIIVIGQLAFGKYVLAQLGLGEHVWSPESKDPVAVQYFVGLWDIIRRFFGGAASQ
jgi:hypothetical protein